MIVSILPFPFSSLPCPSFRNFVWMIQESCNPLLNKAANIFFYKHVIFQVRDHIWPHKDKTIPSERAKVQQNNLFHCFNCTILITDRSWSVFNNFTPKKTLLRWFVWLISNHQHNFLSHTTCFSVQAKWTKQPLLFTPTKKCLTQMSNQCNNSSCY